MERIVLKGQPREVGGTREARRVRREGWVPANLYGHGEANQHFQVRVDELHRVLEDGHHMVTLDLGALQDHSLLKDIQYDPLGEHILHVDFARVSLDEIVETLVPVGTYGTAKGVSAGGILDIVHPEVPVRGKAQDLPERIEVEVSRLQLGEAIHVSDLKFSDGVQCLLTPGEPVVIVHPPRGQESEGDAEGERTEPEVLGAAKPTEEE